MDVGDCGFEVQSNGGVAHLCLNRPDSLNIMRPVFWETLPAAIAELDADETIRVLVISAEGKHFSAGMDVGAFGLMEAQKAEIEEARWRAGFKRSLIRLQKTFSCLEQARFPVIAAIQGGAIGGGVDLISACDIRYSTSDAFFVVMETNIGMMADVGTIPRLRHFVPEGILRELIYSGRKMPASEAERIGLVNRSFPTQKETVAAALSLAQEIADKAPVAILGIKELLNYSRDHSTQETLSFIATWQAGMFSFSDITASLDAQKSKEALRYHDLHLPFNIFGGNPKTA